MGDYGIKKANGKSFCHIKDHVGSIRVIVDEIGVEKIVEGYYPFGMQQPGRSINNSLEDSHRKFNGKIKDENLGLDWLYYGARYYDPEIAVWPGVDPVRQTASPYTFSGNNPVIYVDENGQWFLIDDLIISSVAFVTGYVMTGISTGEWGKDALMNGAIAAGAAWLAYNTGGAAAGALFTKSSTAYALTSATVGGAVGGAFNSAASQQYYSGTIDGKAVGRSAFYGGLGGLAGGAIGQYVTPNPILTSTLGGAIGGAIEGSTRGEFLQGAFMGAYSGTLSGGLTMMAYEQYGRYLTNKYLEEDSFGKDIDRKSFISSDPADYNCKDLCFEMRNRGLDKSIKSVGFGGKSSKHVGFDLGGDLYGHRYILSKQGANFPIRVDTARSLSTGRWLKNGFYYKGIYFDKNSGRYGAWEYLDF